MDLNWNCVKHEHTHVIRAAEARYRVRNTQLMYELERVSYINNQIIINITLFRAVTRITASHIVTANS